MATVQENATLADVKAIETEWNAAIDTEYAAVVAKYPDIDFDDIDPQIISLAEEIEEVHPTTNEPLVWVMNKKTLSKVLQPREVINAIRKKGSKTPTKPLMDTGLMRKVFRSKTASASDLESRVDVAKKRSEIAVFHNDGGSRIPQREWFGIGDKSKKRMNKMIKAKIKQIVRLVK